MQKRDVGCIQINRMTLYSGLLWYFLKEIDKIDQIDQIESKVDCQQSTKYH